MAPVQGASTPQKERYTINLKTIRILVGYVFSAGLLVLPLCAASRWTELNVGPFYVDTDTDVGAARQALDQFEQVRWVLGALLESQDLPSVWPIRVLLTDQIEKRNPESKFVLQSGQWLLVAAPSAPMPLGEVAGILLDSNTPRLPDEVESGMRALFSTLQAHGSRVTWGGAPAKPDLAWARMQLLATRFEYYSSFHIFFTALKSGSSLRVAEQNAFGKDFDALEKEAAANLAKGSWQAIAASGRPLDPRRDFGDHSLDGSIAAVYLAEASLTRDPKSAEATYKSAIEAGRAVAPLGFEGLAQLASLQHRDPKPDLQNAIRAGSRSAPVYVAAAEDLPPDQALPLLKKAAQLNPLWGEPVFQQALLAANPAEKESKLKQATQLDPRATRYWLELAQVEMANGEGVSAQGAWLHAEESAPTQAERDRLHQQRLDSQQEREDAAENQRLRERNAAHLADEQAQQSEADRIRAAEERANKTLDSAAGGAQPSNVVPWSAISENKKLRGQLIQVDCLRHASRLTIRAAAGNVALLLPESIGQKLACGVLSSPRRVSVAYNAESDEEHNTSGVITSFEFQ
ncbi:MAG: hypothetical protein JO138_04270 [Acidobacteriaceae bacterium]|nr:hypothetical protein [Acidobacteriaceae bacterium]